ncbi:M15 family metallopeptidase [Clostridium aestuarii]|nr:M15 family metallopeptidase [Clostridium aestuarii]
MMFKIPDNKKVIPTIIFIIILSVTLGTIVYINNSNKLMQTNLTIKQDLDKERNKNDKLQLENNELKQNNDKLSEVKEKFEEENKWLKSQVKKLRASKEYKGLVAINYLDESIVCDLRYASENNFGHRKFYSDALVLLRKETAQKLIKANEEFKKKGYRIKIWDAYRPRHFQQVFWDTVSDEDRKYFANPKYGSNHNRGAAVDITLIDSDGKELLMPSKFDEFSIKASRKNIKICDEARENMEYLTKVMKENGFTIINSEWWHFNDSNCKEYPLLDISIKEFISKE